MSGRDRCARPRLAVALWLVAVAGCPGEESTPLPEDVDAVLESRCRRCHGKPTANFAPMSIIDWEDTQARAPSGDRAVYEAMEARLTSEMFPMPPVRSEEADAIRDVERQTLLDWIAAGAPPAEGAE